MKQSVMLTIASLFTPQTLGGRYLSVFFIHKPKSRTAVIISACDMSDSERKAYGRK